MVGWWSVWGLCNPISSGYFSGLNFHDPWTEHTEHGGFMKQSISWIPTKRSYILYIILVQEYPSKSHWIHHEITINIHEITMKLPWNCGAALLCGSGKSVALQLRLGVGCSYGIFLWEMWATWDLIPSFIICH